MRFKTSLSLIIGLTFSLLCFSQYGKQKKADDYFNNFSYVKAIEVYKELIKNDYNKDYATRRLAESYSMLGDLENAVIHYEEIVKQPNVPEEYYYNYAQALRSIGKYDESREWFKKFKKSGGKDNLTGNLKESNFSTSVFNAKPQYYISEVPFNSEYSDFGAFQINGKIYFSSTRDNSGLIKRTYSWNEQPFLDIYAINIGDSIATLNSKLPGDVNTKYHEGSLTIGKEGGIMYFTRNNYVYNSRKKDDENTINLKILKATYKNGKWTDIFDLPFNSAKYSTGHPALNLNDSKLYFASDMPGGYGGTDIYVVDIFDNGTYSEPKNLGPVVNTIDNESFPFINNEGTLFFSSVGQPGLGGYDIFATIKNDKEEIIDVVNLGEPINSQRDDFSFFMNNDGLTGFFASNRKKDIGNDDIYAFERVLPLVVEGFVYDLVNKKPIPGATITLFNENEKQIASMKSDQRGYYEFNIDRNADYKLKGSHEKYVDSFKIFTSKEIGKYVTKIRADLILNPIRDVEVLADLNTIYFDFDKYNIRPDAATELDKVIKLINDYPNMILKIESHTDSRGSYSYNNKLSIDRANSVYDYFISKGVSNKKIIAHQGYGEYRLTNGCEDGINCEEPEHQMNRRTEFIILQM